MASKSYGNAAVNQGNIEAGFLALEARTDMPKLEWLDGGNFAAAGGDIVLKGTALTAGNATLDSVQLTESTTELTIAALKPGSTGISVEVLAGEDALAIAYASNQLTITLASGGSTADAIATAINADAAQTEGILRANVDTAGNFTLAIAETALTGGTGTGTFAVYASGVECLPANETGTTSTAKWSATAITCTVPDLTGETDARAIGDLVQIKVVANNIESDSLQAELTA
jgi:hypothetical protein